MDSLIIMFLDSFPTIGLVVIFFISLFILSKGADFLVDEAIILSILWKIPTVIVGATIVSLGTTVPEVTVSAMATLKGNSSLALGNAIGSIITNTTLILGLTALIDNISVDKTMINRQGRVMVIVSILLSIFSLPILNNGQQGLITRYMGALLLTFLAIYIYITIKSSREVESKSGPVEKGKSILIQLVKLLLGALIVILSSKILVPSVELLASRVGIPDSVIAATLVAFGTSVPELITAITAVRRGHGELAIGNVIGANILNVLFVVGLSAVLSRNGLLVPTFYFKLQIPIMIVSTAALYILAKNKKSKLDKFSGGVLLSIYIIYLALNYLL